MALTGRCEELIRPPSPFPESVSARWRVGRVIRTVSFPGMAGSIMEAQICEILRNLILIVTAQMSCGPDEIGSFRRADHSRARCESVGGRILQPVTAWKE